MDTKQCSRCKTVKPVTEFHLRCKREPWLKSACKECHRERARGYWKKKPLPKEVQRERNLRNTFGIGIEDYNNLLESQNHKCAICEVDQCTSGRNFAVDHDHKTGKVRGLLCMYCNTALGKFRDNTSTLISAIKYLEKYKNANEKS